MAMNPEVAPVALDYEIHEPFQLNFWREALFYPYVRSEHWIWGEQQDVPRKWNRRSSYSHGPETMTLYDLPCGGIAWVHAIDDGSNWGSIWAIVATKDESLSKPYMEELRKKASPERVAPPTGVLIDFWTLTQNGPRAFNRHIEVPSWGEIEDNYSERPADGLRHLISKDFSPGAGGRLLLWAGRAGTGKTFSLRALAHEWKDWCQLHYIMDPEQFFGTHPAYMAEILLGSGNDAPSGRSGSSKWRLLVFEDAGEFLTTDAKSQVGQGLSRLLNVVDGLIGQGLKILILITTNEEVGRLHGALTRKGRCASQIEFTPLSAVEANKWLKDNKVKDASVTGATTLADLWAMKEGREATRVALPQSVGFAPASARSNGR